MSAVSTPAFPAALLPPAVSAVLQPDEVVQWAEQPRPFVFILRGWPNVAYAVTWGVLGAFWFRGAGGIGKYSAFEGWWRLTPLFSLPFILAGFSFFFYPIGLGRRARQTWYLVTSQRVMVAELARKGPVRLRTYKAAELAALEVRRRSGGLVDLIFSVTARENPHLQPRLESGFFGISENDQPAELIRSNFNQEGKAGGAGNEVARERPGG